MIRAAHVHGRYLLHFGGAPCGEERWAIEWDESGEVATGEQVMRAPFPFPSTMEWRARTDAERRVVGLEVRWRVGDRLVEARHAADGALWRARIEHAGQSREQQGDYPGRAHVVLGSHVFHAFAFRRLALAPGAMHELPVLSIGPPWMAVEPGRLVVSCTEARAFETVLGTRAARRIEVVDPARGRAEAFAAWVDEHDVVLASFEGEGDAMPWMTLVEYERE